jgi:hypothetical protein
MSDPWCVAGTVTYPSKSWGSDVPVPLSPRAVRRLLRVSMVSSGVFILGVGAVDWYLNYLPRTTGGLLVGIALAIVGGALVAVGLLYSRAFGNAT